MQAQGQEQQAPPPWLSQGQLELLAAAHSAAVAAATPSPKPEMMDEGASSASASGGEERAGGVRELGGGAGGTSAGTSAGAGAGTGGGAERGGDSFAAFIPHPDSLLDRLLLKLDSMEAETLCEATTLLLLLLYDQSFKHVCSTSLLRYYHSMLMHAAESVSNSME